MQTCIRRGLYAALFSGGILVLGAGAASAATPSIDDPLSANQTSTHITAPVTLTTGETEPLEGAPALPSLAGTGTGALLAGNQTSAPINAPVTITTGETEPLEGTPALPSLTGTATDPVTGTGALLANNETSAPINALATVTIGGSQLLERTPVLSSVPGTESGVPLANGAQLTGDQTAAPVSAPAIITSARTPFPEGSPLAPSLASAVRISTSSVPRSGLSGSVFKSPLALNPALPVAGATLMLTDPTGYLTAAGGAGQVPAPQGPGTQTSSSQPGPEFPLVTGQSPVTDTRKPAAGQGEVKMSGVMFRLPTLISIKGLTAAGADEAAAVPGTGTLTDSSGTAVSGPGTVAGSGSTGSDGVSGVCVRTAGALRASAMDSTTAPQLAAMVPQSLAFTALGLVMLLMVLRRNLRAGTVRQSTASSGGFEAGKQQK